MLMAYFSNLSVCSLIFNKKQYKTRRSIRLREWRVIFTSPWLANLFYPTTKKIESTKLDDPVKPSIKSAVSYQEVGRLSTTTDDIKQCMAHANQVKSHVLSFLLRLRTLINL